MQLSEIFLWGKQVGALAYEPKEKIGTFEFSNAFIKYGVDISPIHMPLSSQKFQFPGLNFETYKGLPAVFSDTLPDDFGTSVINAWLAKQGRDPSTFSPLERLLYSGKRGMGALEYQPANENLIPNETTNLEISSLMRMAQEILDLRSNLHADLKSNRDDLNTMSDIFQVGTSAGGARAKALIAINKQRSEIKSGQIDAPPGFEHYLLKFDGVEEKKTGTELFGDPKGYGRIEYAYYLMALDAGINISESELLEEGERAHFMTKRFDRVGNNKIFYISSCAMDHADYKNPGSYSYEELLLTARKLRLSRKDAIEIFRRMVFNVVARNQDDHSKNFGFIRKDIESGWALSPAFDLVYSYKPDSKWVNSHQLSINGKRDNFSKEDLMSVSSLISNFKKEAEDIIQKSVGVIKKWEKYAEEAGVSNNQKQTIANNHRLF